MTKPPDDRKRVWFILDVDHTLKSRNKLWMSPPVFGMPELLHSCTRIHSCTFTYLTNRWSAWESVHLGPRSFLDQYYPPGEVYQRPFGDFFGWVARQPTHKKETLCELIHNVGWTTPHDIVMNQCASSPHISSACIPGCFDFLVLLGDDQDLDPEIYTAFVLEHHSKFPPNMQVLIGIRRVTDSGAGASLPKGAKEGCSASGDDPAHAASAQRIQSIFEKLSEKLPLSHQCRVRCFAYVDVKELSSALMVSDFATGL